MLRFCGPLAFGMCALSFEIGHSLEGRAVEDWYDFMCLSSKGSILHALALSSLVTLSLQLWSLSVVRMGIAIKSVVSSIPVYFV